MRVFMDSMRKILLVILQFFVVVAVCTKAQSNWLALPASNLNELRVN